MKIRIELKNIEQEVFSSTEDLEVEIEIQKNYRRLPKTKKRARSRNKLRHVVLVNATGSLLASIVMWFWDDLLG